MKVASLARSAADNVVLAMCDCVCARVCVWLVNKSISKSCQRIITKFREEVLRGD